MKGVWMLEEQREGTDCGSKAAEREAAAAAAHGAAPALDRKQHRSKGVGPRAQPARSTRS